MIFLFFHSFCYTTFKTSIASKVFGFRSLLRAHFENIIVNKKTKENTGNFPSFEWLESKDPFSEYVFLNSTNQLDENRLLENEGKDF